MMPHNSNILGTRHKGVEIEFKAGTRKVATLDFEGTY